MDTTDKPPRKPRPKKPSTRVQMSLYLSEQERAAIDAARGDVERSTWIREAVLQRLAREGKGNR